MIPSTTAALDAMFADEPEEIVERVLRPYQQILSRTIMVLLRMDLEINLACHVRFVPWRIPREPLVQGIGPLAAVQVALLGGTRPTRTLEVIAANLVLPFDDGDRESEQKVANIYTSSKGADDVIDHHPVARVRGREAVAQKIRDFAELAVAAQFASLMGTLSDRHPSLPSGDDEHEEPELIRRRFLRAVEVFRKLRLTPKAQAVFRDHFLDERDIEDIAEEEGRDIEKEMTRCRVFLQGLAMALAEAVGRPGGDAGTRAALPDAKSRPRALTQATARGARRRTR